MEQVKEELEERDKGPGTVACVRSDASQAQERGGLSQQAWRRRLCRPDKWVLAGRESCCWRGHSIYGDQGACRNGRRAVAGAGT